MPDKSTEAKKPWRLTVVLESPDAEVTLRFKTKQHAVDVIDTVVEKGYLYVDRSEDQSNYDATYVPLHRIRRFDVLEGEGG